MEKERGPAIPGEHPEVSSPSCIRLQPHERPQAGSAEEQPSGAQSPHTTKRDNKMGSVLFIYLFIHYLFIEVSLIYNVVLVSGV